MQAEGRLCQLHVGEVFSPSIPSCPLQSEPISVLSAFCLQDEIICDTEELKEELECLQKEFEKAAYQRIVVQQGQQDAAEVKHVLRIVKYQTFFC